MIGHHMSLNNTSALVARHYATADLTARFDDVLHSWGKQHGPLTPADLAPIDQFHFGGARATAELGAIADLGPGTRVLDVGGGFGGPARMLAASYQCAITVLDLTEAYCEIGRHLTKRCDLQHLVSFHQGDALHMPYPDQAFERVITVHSSMNIENKEPLYREIYRVLSPGGRLLLFENMAGPGGPLHYPVPWAGDESISFLSSPPETHQLLAKIGFHTLQWDDVSDNIASADPALADRPQLHRVLGDEFVERGRNGLRNLAERRAIVIRAMLQR